MRHVRVIIRRDIHTTHNKTCAEWEIPMLEYTFGEEGNVEVTDEYVKADCDYPDPREEFVRLEKVYGKDRKSGVSHAQTVFGVKGVGIRALARAIEEARAAEEIANADRRRWKPKAQRFSKAVLADPLLA